MKDIAEYRGTKSLVALAFVVAFGGALLVSSPAHAAGPTQVFVPVCGNDTDWYVNGDEWTADTVDDGQGDRRPAGTDDGMVFSPTDLIHRQLDFTVDSSLVAGDYTASPEPDSIDWFSIEVVNDDGTGYATLRWNSDIPAWEVTTGGSTTTGADPAALLTGLGKSTHARTFGVGYTNSPPGTVTSTVSSINFMGTAFDLTCAVAPTPTSTPTPTPTTPSPTPSVSTPPTPVPTPVKTTTKTMVIALPEPTEPAVVVVPTEDPVPTPEPTVSTTPEPSPVPTPLMVKPVADSDTGPSGLLISAIVVAAGAGLVLMAVGIARIRGSRSSYTGTHSVDNSQTQMIPAISGDEYNVKDYDPALGGYDPALGGVPGQSHSESEPDETPPADTKLMPPAE